MKYSIDREKLYKNIGGATGAALGYIHNDINGAVKYGNLGKRLGEKISKSKNTKSKLKNLHEFAKENKIYEQAHEYARKNKIYENAISYAKDLASKKLQEKYGKVPSAASDLIEAGSRFANDYLNQPIKSPIFT